MGICLATHLLWRTYARSIGCEVIAEKECLLSVMLFLIIYVLNLFFLFNMVQKIILFFVTSAIFAFRFQLIDFFKDQYSVWIARGFKPDDNIS